MALNPCPKSGDLPLRDRRIRVVEDDLLIAMSVADLLAKESTYVFGPPQPSRKARSSPIMGRSTLL